MLYSFVGTPDGSGPEAGLILHAGIFYGTTYLGGASNSGTVFAVTEKGQETVLYSFSALHQDGHYPVSLWFGIRAVTSTGPHLEVESKPNIATSFRTAAV